MTKDTQHKKYSVLKFKPASKLRKSFFTALTFFIAVNMPISLAPDNPDQHQDALKELGFFVPTKNISQSLVKKDDTYLRAFKRGAAGNISDFIEKYQDNIEYDTITINKDNIFTRICLGQYYPHKKYLEIKKFIPDTTNTSPKIAASILNFCATCNNADRQALTCAHELSHKMFHEDHGIRKKTYRYKMNLVGDRSVKIPYRAQPQKIPVFHIGLRDWGVLNQWNEIGADFGAFLYQRECYKKTRKLSEFKYKTAYVEALKQGTINPFDYSPEAVKKEYSLLINSVIDWWVKSKKNGYAYTCKSIVESMIQASKKDGIMLARDSEPKKWNQLISACLTFPVDGKIVDFSQYVKDKNLTPQPMVEEVIAKAEKELPMYEYNAKPFPLLTETKDKNNPFSDLQSKDAFTLSLLKNNNGR